MGSEAMRWQPVFAASVSLGRRVSVTALRETKLKLDGAAQHTLLISTLSTEVHAETKIPAASCCVGLSGEDSLGPAPLDSSSWQRLQATGTGVTPFVNYRGEVTDTDRQLSRIILDGGAASLLMSHFPLLRLPGLYIGAKVW